MGAHSEALIWPMHVAVVHELRCAQRTLVALGKPENPKYARALSAIEATPAGPRRDLVAAAAVLRTPGMWDGTPARAEAMRIVHAMAPFPEAGLAMRADVVLGKTPSEISGGLPSKDAHAWLSEGALDHPIQWYLARHCSGIGEHVHSVKIAVWLAERWKQPDQRDALCRVRHELGPRGDRIDGAWIHRVDELRQIDLRPSVRETFARCAARLRRQHERDALKEHEPLAKPPRWWRPARCARLLLTPHELAVEGAEMRHCVGSYASEVRRQECVIVALNVLGHRSTVELDRLTGRIRQHKSLGNSEPHELCVRALGVLYRRWGEKLLEELSEKFAREFGPTEEPRQQWQCIEADGALAIQRVR